ncbi:tyrosine-type recombinase/integrase [Marinagarivorans algicola]|uniref:tyrosine-type recombinase/integrase n=1 Tax=Marinagarivorans algicola TaxID=1513270 RepID=UPI0006B507B6|nr:tyrosine-type recombinase/integrase [Marinagarivorans algicola]
MARPKKSRYFNGTLLADNLYLDPKRRDGFWCYKLPNGKNKIFKASTPEDANIAANKANENRDNYTAKKKSKAGQTIMSSLIDDFITYRQEASPDIAKTKSWANRCYAMRKYARAIDLPPNKITRESIEQWWNRLSYNDQKLRHCEFRKLFNFLMGKGYTPQLQYNPFTTSDDRPRLYLKAKPARTRERLNEKGFWAIYKAAGALQYEGLQVAMGLSLITLMREQDILTLRFDQNIKDGILQRVISKSEAQKGYAKAARLQWNTEIHPLLNQIIQRAQACSVKNGKCPFLVSHKPARIYQSKVKEHYAQITKERLGEQFRSARNETKLWANSASPPSFHEVRSLGDMLASRAGFDIKVIQHAMAHSDETMTAMYQASHEMPFEDVKVIFTNEMIGGKAF